MMAPPQHFALNNHLISQSPAIGRLAARRFHTGVVGGRSFLSDPVKPARTADDHQPGSW
jgi:hypothetical protein